MLKWDDGGMVYARHLKCRLGNRVRVRVPLVPPKKNHTRDSFLFSLIR